MFLNYLIVRIVEKARAEDRLDTLSITYVHKPLDFAAGIRFTCTEPFCIVKLGEADYFLSDSLDIADGTLGKSLLLEVASDNLTNYKKFLDRLNEMNGQRIVMDVWTLEELRQVTPEEWTDGEVDFLYKVFGGRVRHVLCGNSNATSVDDVIESTALWLFGNTAKQAYSISWNRALQFIRITIADDLAIQTSPF